ncbi:MAG: ABC transporter permease subunit, partial [Miltoncostaeaceae bacterium]
MSEIFRLSLWRARGRIVALTVGFALFELVVALSYASVDQNAVRQLVDSLPPALVALAGSADVASPGGYLGSAYVHPVALTVQGALVVSMASALARDLDSGQAELILSRPLPVWAWVFAQWSALAVGLAAVAAGGFLGGLAGISTVDALSGVEVGSLAAVSAGGYLVFLAFGGIALLVATLAPSGGRAVGWAAGIVLVSYALDYLADIWTIAEPLGPLSPFHYYDPGVILTEGRLPATDALLLTLVAAC